MTAQKKIIVVDDDPAVQDVVRRMLEYKGYAITVYPNGEPLLEGLPSWPDLIILDKQLPGIDGVDICRFLKTQEATKHIPILMLSASPQAGAMAKAICADDFLEKPFRMQALRQAVEQLIT